MYTALVEQFYDHGHQVDVVAPAGEPNKSELRRENGIRVLRVKTLPLKNVSIYVKGISNLLLPFQFKRAIKKHFQDAKYDLIIIPTPPITFADLATNLKKKHDARLYLMPRDIFPQGAVDLGFMKKGSAVYRYFRSKEKKLYRQSDYIGCMSPGNIKYIQKNNSFVPKDKLHELKNFQIKYKGFGHNDLIKKYGLKGNFTVIFGGNMGKPQQLENVLTLAEKVSEYPDVFFLLLGEGVAMQKLKKNIEERKIKNIKIHSSISKQEYQDLLTVCDIGLISLNQNFTVPNIPSKTLDYFNVGLPVLASIDKATDFNEVLEEAKAGLWSYAGDHEKFKENFDKLYFDKPLRKEMAENGRKYFHKYLTPDIAYRTIMEKIKD
jgi:glycosyltransferase involved in cell wall biosynthesis